MSFDRCQVCLFTKKSNCSNSHLLNLGMFFWGFFFFFFLAFFIIIKQKINSSVLHWVSVIELLLFWGVFATSFNPVAPTAMMKVLTRISTVEAGKVSRILDADDKLDFYV